VVLDPFSGSNVTGEAAEALGRKWISCDLDSDRQRNHSYVRASAFRFDKVRLAKAYDFEPSGDYAPKTKQAD
jgi:site-specific DNA-methyltransferase (cytosine-N4-specific)